jgi:diguanylate cyclase (GGDEF)-like protein/PAS domain S-box-containing protein
MSDDASRFAETDVEALCVLGEHGRVQYANPAFGQIAGCGPSAVKDRPFADFAHPEDQPAVRTQLDEACSTPSPLTFTFRVGPAGGPYNRVECTLHPADDSKGIFAVLREARAAVMSEVCRVAMESSPSATVVVDAAGRVVMVNREAEHLFGYRDAELVGHSIEILVPEVSRANHVTYREAFSEDPSARPMGFQRDLSARRRDGSIFPVEIGLNPIHTSNGIFFVSAIVDLSERKLAEQQIVKQAKMLERAFGGLLEMASTDSLTSLWNRRAFLEQLTIQLDQAVRSGQPISVLLVDVDHFKSYNDSYGHLAGDEVLKGVAGVLRAKARQSDYVARIGGEEFGVILPETDRSGSVQLAERFRIAIDDESWPRREITASFGASTVAFARTVPRPEAPGFSEVLAAADQALYYSKEHGRNCVTHFSDLTAMG